MAPGDRALCVSLRLAQSGTHRTATACARTSCCSSPQMPLQQSPHSRWLLAWVVADARGAARPMDKALADSVGKRLEKQAQKVREKLADASVHASQAREDAKAAAVQGQRMPLWRWHKWLPLC
mmetsp:Transcript_61429/g.121534  ORF Transcript_61429/g.121534 Transcript_61429/m.121534 type:complete len:123 (+) Transcript_61429:1102-1470(+)